MAKFLYNLLIQFSDQEHSKNDMEDLEKHTTLQFQLLRQPIFFHVKSLLDTKHVRYMEGSDTTLSDPHIQEEFHSVILPPCFCTQSL